MEDAMVSPTTTIAQSEGTMTDEDVHLSPSSLFSSGGGGGGGCGGGFGGCGGGCGGGGVIGRIKILCSFGGRIMPRPSDGTLKYIGGETRVLAVPRSIRFGDLKKKLEEMFRTEVAAIKYQLLAEDLDLLVSVTCDEDLIHMLDEYDRLEAKRSPTASPRFRVYVFASRSASLSSAAPAPTVSSTRHPSVARPQPQYHRYHHHYQAERYVATVPATPYGSPPCPVPPNGAISAGNSPRASVMDSVQTILGLRMQRVRSSPNLGGLDVAPQRFHQHTADGGGGVGVTGYLSSSPGHGGAAHHFQGSYHHYRQPHPQYSAAPVAVPVPHHAGVAGRYDTRGYVRGGSYLAPMVPVVRSSRPVSRNGPLFSEVHTSKKATTIWD